MHGFGGRVGFLAKQRETGSFILFLEVDTVQISIPVLVLQIKSTERAAAPGRAICTPLGRVCSE